MVGFMKFLEILYIYIYNKETLIFFYIFRGTSGIDIDLQKVDIDQCPSPPSGELNVFADSARCKKDTTKVG